MTVSTEDSSRDRSLFESDGAGHAKLDHQHATILRLEGQLLSMAMSCADARLREERALQE